MHTFAPRIDVLLRVSRPPIRRGQPTFFAFGTCGSDAERVVAPSEGSGVELNFWKDTHPTREADDAEVLLGARRVGEQLVQKHLNGCVCLYMDVLHRLNMQEYVANRAEWGAGSRAPQE